MSDEEEDRYGLFVKVTHPDRPTVEIGLTWNDPKPPNMIADSAYELAKSAVRISLNMEAVND